MNKPNVILIMTDQQRWDTLSCAGNPVIQTPNLDYLASEGTLFTNAYSCTPSCIPARASLLTGMNPWNTGILGMGRGQGPMGTGFLHTLPGELAKAGYHTQGVGKMHFSPQRALNGFHRTVLDESGRAESPGFVSDYRRWFEHNKTGDYQFTDHGIGWNSWMARPYHAPEYLHPTNWTVNESIQFLKDRDPGKPFFLKMSFARPHSPYDALPYFFDLYMRKKIPPAAVGQWASIHDDKKTAYNTDAWRGKRTEEDIHQARAGYYGSINHIDHQIGRLFHYVKQEKLWQNTLILFTSDHGDMLGDHNLWRKTYAYEGSAHVPMIVKLPSEMGHSVKEKVDAPVVLQDMMPTILDAMGLEIPGLVDGRSVLPLMLGEDTAWREYIHGEHSTCYSEEQEMQYVTDGRMKYIWFPRLGTEQLFDLASDRYELHERSGDPDYADLLNLWRGRLISELEPRNTGLTDGGRLLCQAGKPPIVSPYYNERKERADKRLGL